MHHSFKSSFAMVVCLTLIMTNAITFAEDTRRDVLEEVVVTATRVEKSLQEVPISVTVLTNKDLSRAGISRVKDLESAVPNLVITGSAHNAFFPLAIRGIFSESRVNGFELAYGVYVDGVYMGRPMATNLDLVEVERIEVLRGPQGTLFGRNTIAGAINITTRKPNLEEPKLYVEVNVGNFNKLEARAAASYPIIPGKLAIQASGVRLTEEGYITNIFQGQNLDFNNEDNLSGRFQLTYTPSQDLEINLSADVLTEDRRVVFNEIGLARGERLAPGKFTVNNDTVAEGDRDLWGISATVDYTLSSGHKLTSVTAYREGESFFVNDNDNTPVRQTEAPFVDELEQFSQEFRIASPQDQQLRYVAGVFYLNQDTLTKHDLFVGTNATDPNAENSWLIGLPFPLGFDSLDESTHTIETDAIAVFGNIEYDLFDRLTLLAGVRYTHEEKDLAGFETGLAFLGLPTIGPFTDSISDDDVSPTAGLLYRFTDKINTYFRWSKGFRSGGYNNDLFIPSTDISFRSETVDAFEIGLKTQWWDDRVRINIAAFFTDYKDLQQPSFDDAAAVPFVRITNAGSAEVKGVEVDYAAIVTPEITLKGGFSYTDATFTNFRNVLVIGDSFDGFRLPKVPEWTANASLTYETPLQSFDGKFIARLDWSYRSDLFSETRNDPRELVPGRSIVNGRIGVSVGEHWELFFWGKNILDKEYLNERRSVDAFGQLWLNYGKPRSFGVQASYRY